MQRASYQDHSSIPNRTKKTSVIRPDQDEMLKELEITVSRLRKNTHNKAALAVRVTKLRSLVNEFLRSL